MAGLVCSVCGQNEMIAVDGEEEMFKCAFCGTKYTKEQLQQKLVKLDGPVKIDGAVQVEGVQNLEKLLENGETFLSLEEYSKASDVYTKLTNEYPEKYQSWYGFVKCSTYMGNDVSDKLKTAKKLATEYEKKLMLNEIETIADGFRQKHKSEEAHNFYRLLTSSYPESYKGWYGFVLTDSNNLKEKANVSDFNTYLKKAMECAEKESNQVVIDNLKTYEDIVKNINEIESKQEEIKKLNNIKSSKIGDSKALTEKNKTSKQKVFNDFKVKEMSAYQQSYLEKTTTETELEEKKQKHKMGWKKLIPSLIKSLIYFALFLVCVSLILGTIVLAFSGIGYFFLCLFIVGPITFGIATFIWTLLDYGTKVTDSLKNLWTIPEVLFGGFKIRRLKNKITSLQKDMDNQQSTANVNIESEQAQMSKVLEDLQKEYDKNVQEIVNEYQEKVDAIQKEIDEILEKNKKLKDTIIISNIQATVN